MEHRPHSGPEQCNNFILAYIYFLFGLKFKFYDIAYFLCVCYSYNSEKTGQTLKKHNTGQWDPPQYSAFCNNLSRIQTFNIWPYSSKQTPENLSNAGSFFTGKYYSIKVCLSQEKHFFNNLKLMYYSLLLFQEKMRKRHVLIVDLHWAIGSHQIPHGKSTPDGVLPAFMYPTQRALNSF